MTTEKIVSYTPEQTTQVIAAYTRGEAIEAIALSMGKTVKSVVAKLVREKVYVAKAPAKSARVTKAQLISAIAVKFGVEAESLESLEKATKETLEILAGV